MLDGPSSLTDELESLARDLAILCLESNAYRLVSLQPMDMFPQTAHVESIAVFER